MQASVRVTSLILALKELRQKDYCELKVNLGYKMMAISCLQINLTVSSSTVTWLTAHPGLKLHQGKTSELIFGL